MMKLRKTFLFVVIIALGSAFTSCRQNAIVDTTKTINDGVWKSSDVVKFSVAVTDTMQAYNYYINVRNSADYPFSNLFLFIKTLYPNGKISIDTVECYLADAQGKWYGHRSGNKIDNRILFRKSIRFRQSGNYSFEFEQAMRTEEIHGIESFGIRIEKFEKEK
jgi:gliding motility-associated lipoprotein GldH